MSNRRDVQLVVRARAEGEKLVENLNDALRRLGDTQDGVADSAGRNQSKLGQFASALNTLRGAFSGVDAAASKADSAFQRQQSRLQETRAQLAQVATQIKAAAAAIAQAERDVVEARMGQGRLDRFGGFESYEQRVAELQAAKAAVAALTAEQQKLKASVQIQQIALGEAENSLLAIGVSAHGADAQLAELAQRFGLTGSTAEAMTAELRDQARAAEAVGTAIRAFGVAQQQVAERQRAAAAAAAELTAEINRQADAANILAAIDRRTGTGRVAATSAGASFGALDEQARAAQAIGAFARESGAVTARSAQELADKVARLRAEINPLGALQERYNRALREARDLQRQGAISAKELADREHFLAEQLRVSTEQLKRRGRGEMGAPSLFGLKPYELTNLGYQINDIVTQLASGTSLMQTLAQQGGQVLQLFPRLGATIVAALGNPVIIATAAALTLIVMALREAEREAARLRSLESLLTRIGNQAGVSARELSDLAETLDRAGLTAEQALGTISKLVGDLNPAVLQQVALAARDAADALGMEAAEAAEQLRIGLTGGFEQVARMSDALGNILRPAELEHIRLMFESGRAAEARAEALRIVTNRLDEMGDEIRGPWTRAARGAETLWRAFLRAVSDAPPIQAILYPLRELAEVLGAIGDEQERIANAGSIGQHLGQQFAGIVDPRNPNGDAAAAAELEAARGHMATLESIELETQLEQARRSGIAANQIAIAGEIEYRRILAETSDQRRAAMAREVGEMRERNRLQQQSRQLFEQAIQQFVRRTIAVESGGNSNARPRNADGSLRSSALGVGQFIESTWLSLFRKYFPQQAEGMSRQAILELRRDQEVSRRLIELYARENAAVLQRAGQAVTQANLYLTHFLGPQQAVRVLRAPVDTPLASLLQPGTINANPEMLRGKTAGQLRSRVNNMFGEGNGPQMEAEQSVLERIAQQEAQRAVQQENFNRRIEEANAQRSLETEHLRRQLGLSGEQLRAEQRDQAVRQAILDAEQEAARQQLTLTDAQRQAIEATTRALLEQQHAQESATQGVDLAQTERDALLSRLETAREMGDAQLVRELEQRIRDVDTVLRDAIARAIEFWRQFDTPEARSAITNLETMRDGIAVTAEQLTRGTSEQQLEQFQAQRDALLEQIRFFEQEGQGDVVAQLRDQLAGLNTQVLTVIDDLIAFWQVSSRPEAQATLMALQNLRNEILTTGQEFRVTAGTIQQMFASSLTNSIASWAQQLGEGRNAISATWDALRGFAADFLRQMAMMVLQAAALKLAMKFGFGGMADGINSLFNVAPLIAAGATLTVAGTTMTGASGTLITAAGAWAVVATQIMAAAQMLLAANAAGGGGAGIFHAGGIAGSATRTRSVWPGIFASAARYHVGGIAGLRPGEVPAILERGEEILKRSDPRHVLNGGGGAGAPGGEPRVDLQIVNAIDSGDVVSKGLNTRPGQRSFMNLIRSNAGAIRSILS